MFNWVDALIVIFFALYLFVRRKKGFLYELFDLLGFLLSLVIALSFYKIAGTFLVNHTSLTRGFAGAIAFLLIAFFSEPLFLIIFASLNRIIPEKIIQSRLNKILFCIPAVISGIILAAFILTASLALPIRPDIKQAVATSKIGGFITDQTSGLEKRLSDVFGGAIQDSLNFLTVEPKSEESINLNFKTNNTTVDYQSEQKMFTLVNFERTSRGLSTLILNTNLQKVARLHCTDMFARGYFSHVTPDGKSPFDRMADANITYLAAGENLAYAPTIDIAHRGLMESPGHRANILSKDFGHIGIGVIDAGIYGKMFCQEFIN